MIIQGINEKYAILLEQKTEKIRLSPGPPIVKRKRRNENGGEKRCEDKGEDEDGGEGPEARSRPLDGAYTGDILQLQSHVGSVYTQRRHSNGETRYLGTFETSPFGTGRLPGGAFGSGGAVYNVRGAKTGSPKRNPFSRRNSATCDTTRIGGSGRSSSTSKPGTSALWEETHSRTRTGTSGERSVYGKSKTGPNGRVVPRKTKGNDAVGTPATFVTKLSRIPFSLRYHERLRSIQISFHMEMRETSPTSIGWRSHQERIVVATLMWAGYRMTN